MSVGGAQCVLLSGVLAPGGLGGFGGLTHSRSLIHLLATARLSFTPSYSLSLTSCVRG